MKISFAEIAKRITGISCPVFGISWNPPTLERDIARRMLAYFEDRRAFYEAYEEEFPDFVVESILQVRQRITQELQVIDRTTEIAQHLSAIRIACRKFLTTVGRLPALAEWYQANVHRKYQIDEVDAVENWDSFWSGLGELRGVVGLHIACVAAKYGVDVEEDLAMILPEKQDPEADERVNSQWEHFWCVSHGEMNTASAKGVAEWMVEQLEHEDYLSQADVVYWIKVESGDKFLRANKYGNLVIDKRVLKEFRKLTGQTVVWERGAKMWHKRDLLLR